METKITDLISQHLSPAIIIVTALVCLIIKSFTCTEFNKLFLPKYQKIVYNLLNYIVLLIVSFIGAVPFSLIADSETKFYEDFKKYVPVFWIISLFLAVLTTIIKKYIIPIIKKIVKAICKKQITLSIFHNSIFKSKTSKVSLILNWLCIKFLNFAKCLMLVFKKCIEYLIMTLNVLTTTLLTYIVFYEMIYLKHNKIPLIELVSYIIGLSFFFMAHIILLIKFIQWLKGEKKKKWNYILLSQNNDLKDKELYVLEALNSTTLVLSEEIEYSNKPITFYLYDINKDSYTCFKRYFNKENSNKN